MVANRRGESSTIDVDIPVTAIEDGPARILVVGRKETDARYKVFSLVMDAAGIGLEGVSVAASAVGGTIDHASTKTLLTGPNGRTPELTLRREPRDAVTVTMTAGAIEDGYHIAALGGCVITINQESTGPDTYDIWASTTDACPGQFVTLTIAGGVFDDGSFSQTLMIQANGETARRNVTIDKPEEGAIVDGSTDGGDTSQEIDPNPIVSLTKGITKINDGEYDVWVETNPITPNAVVTFRAIVGCEFTGSSTIEQRTTGGDGETAPMRLFVLDPDLGATMFAEAANALDLYFQIDPIAAPPPVPPPDPIPPPPSGSNLTPASLLPFYREIRAAADDPADWPTHINSKVAGSLASILATINAGDAHPVVDAAGGENSHYGTLHCFIAQAIRQGLALDDTNPDIETVLKLVRSSIAWQKDGLQLDLDMNPLPGRQGQVAKPSLMQPYKITNALDLFTVWSQYTGSADPVRAQMAADARTILHRNGVWYSGDSWSSRARLGSADGPYTSPRPIAIFIEVWSMLHKMGVPYTQEPSLNQSGVLKEGSWLREVEKGVEIVGLLLNDVLTKFGGQQDANGITVAYGDLRCAASSWRYTDPVAKTGKTYISPYAIIFFQDGMLAYQLEHAFDQYAIAEAATYSEAIVEAAMRYYRNTTKCLPYLSAHVGPPNGSNNDAPILNHYWPVAALKVARRTGDPAIRQFALNLMAGTAGINWNWNMKQSQQLVDRIYSAAPLV